MTRTAVPVTASDHPAEPSHHSITTAERDAPAHETALASGTRTIVLDGCPVAYTLRTSQRAKRLRLVVRPETGLEVTVPRGVPMRRVEQVLAEKARWIERSFAQVASRPSPMSYPLETGTPLTYCGRTIHLDVQRGPGRPRVALRGDTLCVTATDTDAAVIRDLVRRWYRRAAREVFAERTAYWNTGYGFSYGRIAVKDQKSRWGSCSRQGNLNFNWRLLLAPLPVLNYVVIHELAHLREPNHSPAFWALVAEQCPDYKTDRRWLRLHGHELRL